MWEESFSDIFFTKRNDNKEEKWEDERERIVKELIGFARNYRNVLGICCNYSGAWGYSFQYFYVFATEGLYSLHVNDLTDNSMDWHYNREGKLLDYTFSGLRELFLSSEAQEVASFSSFQGTTVGRDEFNNPKVINDRLDSHPWQNVGRVTSFILYSLENMRQEYPVGTEIPEHFTKSEVQPVQYRLQTGKEFIIAPTWKEFGSYGDVANWVALRKPLSNSAAPTTPLHVFMCKFGDTK